MKGWFIMQKLNKEEEEKEDDLSLLTKSLCLFCQTQGEFLYLFPLLISLLKCIYALRVV